MDVILLEKIRNLGGLGDQVKVRAGFGRNFLIPHGKAVIANARNREIFEARRAELEKQHGEVLAAAQRRAAGLTGLKLTLTRKASEEGKLFGSVSAGDIVDAAQAQGQTLERSEVHLSEGPIKAAGDYEIAVSLHPEVNLTIAVTVVGEI